MLRKLIELNDDLGGKVKRVSKSADIKAMETIRRVLIDGFNLKKWRKHWESNN